MINRSNYILVFTFVLFWFGNASGQEKEFNVVSFIADPSQIKLYWKDDKGQIFRNIQNLKSFVEKKNQVLVFAMNGGMYTKENSPQGLFIQNMAMLNALDTLSGTGNFYLKPNGVFYITDDSTAVVCETKAFVDAGRVNFATQSGPMLIINGEIHQAFNKGSSNLNIRNGVGILPDNRVVFAMSKGEVNFYEFAEFFQKLGCKNALYLDGFVSRTYLPEDNWKQLDGNFGVIIAVTN